MTRHLIILIALAAAAAACSGTRAAPETPETAGRALDSSAQNLEVDVRLGCEREFNRRFSYLSSRAAMPGRSGFDDSLFVLQELPEGRMRFEWDTYMRVEAMRTYNIYCEGIIDMDGNILSISMDAREQII